MISDCTIAVKLFALVIWEKTSWFAAHIRTEFGRYGIERDYKLPEGAVVLCKRVGHGEIRAKEVEKNYW